MFGLGLFFFILIFSIPLIKTQEIIVNLNFSNHDTLITSKNFAFLFFYTKWCDHCNILMKEIVHVAQYYESQKDPSILFAQINGVIEKALLEKYDVREYPKIKFLIGKVAYDYTGGRTAKEIIGWIDSKTKETTKEISNDLELEQAIKNHDFFILYLGKNNYKFDIFLHVSRLTDNETFLHCFDENIRQQYLGNKEWTNILLFKKEFPKVPLFYEGDITSILQIQDFIQENRLLSINNFTSKFAEKVFGEQNKAIFLFLNDSVKSQEAFAALQKCADNLKDKILITVVYPNLKELDRKVAEILGVNQSNFPCVILLFPFN